MSTCKDDVCSLMSYRYIVFILDTMIPNILTSIPTHFNFTNLWDFPSQITWHWTSHARKTRLPPQDALPRCHLHADSHRIHIHTHMETPICTVPNSQFVNIAFTPSSTELIYSECLVYSPPTTNSWKSKACTKSASKSDSKDTDHIIHTHGTIHMRMFNTKSY